MGRDRIRGRDGVHTATEAVSTTELCGNIILFF